MIDEEGQIVPKHAKRSGKKNREKATKGADKSEQVVNMAAMLSAYYPSDISGEAFFPMLTGGMDQYDTQSSDSDENCTTCNRPGHYAHTCSAMGWSACLRTSRNLKRIIKGAVGVQLSPSGCVGYQGATIMPKPHF